MYLTQDYAENSESCAREMTAADLGLDDYELSDTVRYLIRSAVYRKLNDAPYSFWLGREAA